MPRNPLSLNNALRKWPIICACMGGLIAYKLGPSRGGLAAKLSILGKSVRNWRLKIRVVENKGSWYLKSIFIRACAKAGRHKSQGPWLWKAIPQSLVHTQARTRKNSIVVFNGGTKNQRTLFKTIHSQYFVFLHFFTLYMFVQSSCHTFLNLVMRFRIPCRACMLLFLLAEVGLYPIAPYTKLKWLSWFYYQASLSQN